MSSQPSGSTMAISASGQASDRPDASPPPPQQATIWSGPFKPALAKLLGDFNARAALPFDDPCIAECVDQSRTAFLDQCAPQSRRAIRSRGRRGRCRLPSARVASSFICGALEGMTIVAAIPSRLGSPRDALGMVTARNADDALCTLLFGQVGQPVPCAADLERADGLQHLRLAPDRDAIDFQRQQRRGRQDFGNLGRRAQHALPRRLPVCLSCHKRPLYAAANESLIRGTRR